MTRSPFTRRLIGATAGLLTVAGLLTSSGAQGAAADFRHPLSTPLLLSVDAISASFISVRWQDTSSAEFGYQILAMTAPGQATHSTIGQLVPAVPGQGGIGSATMSNLQPDTRYCVRVNPHRGALVSLPGGGYPFQSDEICVTTPRLDGRGGF